MNCPVCNRNNAFNLSICPSCGAMMNDTVREELLRKVSISKSFPKIEMKENSFSGELIEPTDAIIENEPIRPTIETAVSAPLPPMSGELKTATANIDVKQTSPTLVEFHSKRSAVPEWRLQLQNVVRQRQERENQPPAEVFDPPAVITRRQARLATSGAAALKFETVAEKKPAPLKNPTLNSALARIEKSRQRFFVEEGELSVAPVAAASPRPATKNYPFYIASKQAEVAAKLEQPKTAVEAVKMKLAAASRRNESGDLDTNKLPPLSTIKPLSLETIAQPAQILANFLEAPTIETPQIEIRTEIKTEEKIEIKPAEIKENFAHEIAADERKQHEETEDFAPFAMRFNAGLFDLIIGAFLSLILLAPFMLTGGEASWLTFAGVLAFLATCSIVMFIYLTTAVGFYGRTFGMRLFSLEVVDIDGENYPTLHQSAVSAAVYLLSLAFCGAGFLTLLFNEDRRAVHDLASGTIVVKET